MKNLNNNALHAFGGVIGSAEACTIRNSYNAGTIPSNLAGFVGSITGECSFESCYYLNSDNGKGVYNGENPVGLVGVDSDRLKQLENELGSRFVKGSDSDGYPKLDWEQ